MSDTTTTPRQLLEQTHRLILEGRLEEYGDMFAEDGVLETPFAPPGMPRRVSGRTEIQALFGSVGERLGQATRLTSFDYTAVHEATDPEVVVAEFEVHGERTDGGAPFSFSDVIVLRARDGRILSMRDYWSPLDRVDHRALAEDAPA